jgi:hypothetical protein
LSGLTNGPIIYQKYMNNILFDYLDDFYIIYLNNILIYSNDPLEHKIYIRLVLQKLYNTGQQADIKKYEFNITRTKYLGFIILTNNISVDLEKIFIIQN